PGHANDPSCELPGDVDSNTNQPQLGYYPANSDRLNTRFFHMRQRYGLDPQFPIARYVVGLSSALVPNRDSEHMWPPPDPVGPGHDYVGKATCTTPLFAQHLPAAATDELCALPNGPRAANLVVFAVIAGVPNALLTPTLNESV